MAQDAKQSTNFSRGLNSKIASHLIGSEEVQVSENFLYDEGAPYVRQGHKLYNQSSNLAGPVLSLGNFYNRNLSSFFIGVASTQLNVASLSGTFVTLSSESMSSPPDFANFNDGTFIVATSSVPLFFDGSSIIRVGLSSPTHRVQIADFETDEAWTTGIVDTQYLHVEKGLQAFRIGTSGTGGSTSGLVRTDLSINLDLTKFGTISSVDNDLIKFFMIPERRTDISTIDILFDANDGDFSNTSVDCYFARITNLSSYNSLQTNGVGITYTIPKVSFSAPTSSVYSWSSVVSVRLELAQNSAPTDIIFDNIRMEKTPPIPIPQSENFVTSSPSVPTNPRIPIGAQPIAGVVQVVPSKVQEAEEGIRIDITVTSGMSSGVQYFYKTTFVKEGHNGIEIESNPTLPSSGIILGGNLSTHQFVQLRDVPVSDDPDVTARKVYRRRATDANYFYVDTIYDNSTEIFSDDMSDGLLGSVLEEDHNPPPLARYILKTSRNQLFMYNLREGERVHPSRVRWSKTYEPHYYPLVQGIDVAPEDGSEGTGMFEFFNLIHLLKDTSTWMVDENYLLRNIHKTIGCVAPYSIAKSEDAVFWLSNNSIIEYKMAFRRISDGKKPEGNSIKDIIKRLPDEYRENAQGTYFDGFYLLAVTDQGSTVNNLVLCWDTKTETWTTFPNFNVRSWNVTDSGTDPYKLYFGNYSGEVHEMFTGNYDHSSIIASKIRSKEFGIASPETAFRHVYLQNEALDGEQRDIRVTPYVDFVDIGQGQSQTITSTHAITKYELQQEIYGNYCSVEIESSGRYRVSQMDLYGQEKSLR